MNQTGIAALRALRSSLVTNPLDIGLLPWVGNHYDDAPLFEAVEDYITKRCPSSEDAARALEAMCWYGMGVDEQYDDLKVAEYLDACEIVPTWCTILQYPETAAEFVDASKMKETGVNGEERYTAEDFCIVTTGETGWCVKDGDDTLCDCDSEATARRIASLLNADEGKKETARAVLEASGKLPADDPIDEAQCFGKLF